MDTLELQIELNSELVNEVNRLRDQHAMDRAGITRMKQQLATTEVQRDTALEACRAMLEPFGYQAENSVGTYRCLVCDQEDGLADTDYPEGFRHSMNCPVPIAEAALTITPERAASVVEERDRLREALDEFRDAVLHDRYQLEGEGMDSDKTNAVLSLFDELVGHALATPVKGEAP